MYDSPYFTWLQASASPQVKRELQKMERSKRSSFSSTRTILKERYGRDGKTFTKRV